MPKYDLTIGGHKYRITSEHELSDKELTEAGEGIAKQNSGSDRRSDQTETHPNQGRASNTGQSITMSPQARSGRIQSPSDKKRDSGKDTTKGAARSIGNRVEKKVQPKDGTTTSPLALRDSHGNLARTTIGPQHAAPEPNLLQKLITGFGDVMGYPQGLVSAAALPLHQGLQTYRGMEAPTAQAGKIRDQERVKSLMQQNILQRAHSLTGQNPLDPLMGRTAAQGIRDPAEKKQFGFAGGLMRMGTQMGTDPVSYVFSPAASALPRALRVAVMGAFASQMAASGGQKVADAVKYKDKDLAVEGSLELAMAAFAGKHAHGEFKSGAMADELRNQIRIQQAEGKPVSPAVLERLSQRFKVPVKDITPPSATTGKARLLKAVNDPNPKRVLPGPKERKPVTPKVAPATPREVAQKAQEEAAAKTAQDKAKADREAAQKSRADAGQARSTARTPAKATQRPAQPSRTETRPTVPPAQNNATEPIVEANNVARTSVRQVPSLFSKIPWVKGETNADLGGGKYDEGTNYLETQGVTNHIVDDFNRSKEHNEEKTKHLTENPADTGTVSNVLNVIQDPAIRKSVIERIGGLVKPGGKIYFSVYEGNKSGTGAKTSTGSWQENRKTSTYLDEVKSVYPDAKINKRVIEATNKGGTDATQAGVQPESQAAEHKGNDKGGAQAKPSRSSSVQPAAQVQGKGEIKPTEFREWINKQPHGKVMTRAAPLFEAWKQNHPGTNIKEPEFAQMLHDLPREEWHPTSPSGSTKFVAKSSSGSPVQMSGIARTKTEATPEPANPIVREPIVTTSTPGAVTLSAVEANTIAMHLPEDHPYADRFESADKPVLVSAEQADHLRGILDKSGIKVDKSRLKGLYPAKPSTAAPKSTAPVRPPEYGSQNKGVTTEEYNAARERVRKMLELGDSEDGPKSLHSGIPLDDLIKLGAYHLEAGARSLATWIKQMKADLGEKFPDEHLHEIWDHIQNPEDFPYTGARNKITEPEREHERHLSDVERHEYAKVGDAFLLGKSAIVDKGVDHHALAEDIAKRPRVLSVEEVGTLAYGRYLIKQRYDALGVVMDKAISDGDKQMIRLYGADLADVNAKFDMNDQALVRGGREQSAAFNARKIVISDEGDFLDMKAAGRRAAGRELTTVEEGKIEKLTKEITEVREREAKLIAENTKLEAQAAVDRLAEIARLDKRRGRIKDLKIERDKLVQALQDVFGKRTSLSATGPIQVTYEASIVLGKLAVNLIESGYHTLAEVVEQVHNELPGIFTDRQIHDALSGYGRDVKKAASELAKKKAELKKEAAYISKTEDEPGIDTRVERAPSETDNPHIISMRDELSEYHKQRERGEQIAYLENQLATKEIVPKLGDKKAYPKSEGETRLAELKTDYAEAQKVIDLHERIEAERQGVETRTKPADKRAASEEVKSLEAELSEYHKQRDTKKAIEELQKKLDADEIDRPQGRAKNRPRTEDAEKLSELKKEYRERQSALTRMDDIHNEIEELTNSLNLGKIEPKDTSTKADHPKSETETRLDELKAEYRKQQTEMELRSKLAAEVRGSDTRVKKIKPDAGGAVDAEIKRLRGSIDKERKIRDLTEEVRIMEAQEKAGILKGPVKLPPVKVDPRLQFLNQRKAFLKTKMKSALRALEPKSLGDRYNDLGRTMKLAGVAIFAKIGAASFIAMPVETIANALSVPFGKLKVKGQSLSSIAEREGQFSFRTEANAYRSFASRKALGIARDNFTESIDAISAEAGSVAHGDEFSSWPGRLHGVVKSFLKTAEYDKACAYRTQRAMEQAAAEGRRFNPNDPETYTRIGYGAACDAVTMILQGDNKFAELISYLASAPERITGKSWASPIGKLTTALGKSLVPLSRVASNYTGKAIRMTGAGLAEGAYRHARAQFSKEPLDPREADEIIRAYKYGGLGLVAAVIGLTQPAWFKSAGFFARKGGTDPRKDSKGSDMNPSEFVIGGHRVSHLFAHNPFLEAIQFWSTIGRGVEQQKALVGLGEAGRGLAQQAPGLESLPGAGSAIMGQGFDPQGFLGEYARGMVEPQVASEIARWQDIGPTGLPDVRKSAGFGGKVQLGVPDIKGQPKGFRRKDLPLKGASASKTPLQKEIDKMLPKRSSTSNPIRDAIRGR